jgi:tRNA 2-thiocytidine biosynthesis protein TtcA
MADLVPITRLQRCQVAPAPVARPAPPAAEPSRLTRLLLRKVGQAIADFPMIEEGDRLMVCVSGGKDSYALLDLLLALKRRAPVEFELLAVNVDQGWPGYRTDLIQAHLEGRGVPHRMVRDDFATIVEANVPAGKTPCSLCSRLRRGLLYNLAVELGCTKIALGHHMDDLIETLVLNLFYSGKLASMPAILRSDDGRNTVIRPLAYVPEAMLVEYAAERAFPLVSCGCPSCGLPEQKRQVVKQLLGQLEESEPGLKQNMLAALRNVKASHLLDRELASANLQGTQPVRGKERDSDAF